MTLSAKDRYQLDIELLKMYKGGFYRYCWSTFGDNVHVNSTFRKSNHYYNQSRVSFKDEFEVMPIYTSSRKINTKKEELAKRIDDIMNQWFGKGVKEYKYLKPMNINI